MTQRDILPLTGLRGMAALGVAFYHLLLPAHLVGGLAGRVLGRFYLAVDLFFILSGFVLAMTAGELFAGAALWRAFSGFIRRRWARIVPLYGAILVARLIYTALRYGTFNLPRPWIAAPVAHPWLAIPANLLLVQSWGVAPSIIGPAWSISTEWGAYLLFPLLAIAVLHRGKLVCATAVAVALGAIAAASAQSGSLDCWNSLSFSPMLRCLGGFTLGMALWRLSRGGVVARIAGMRWCNTIVWCALACGLVAGMPDLTIYPALPALILCLACGRPGWLASAGPVWLGQISYALYLLHIFLLHPLDQARAAIALVLPAPACDVIAVAGVLFFLLAAADLAHTLIEVPARQHLAKPRAQKFPDAFFWEKTACLALPIVLDSPIPHS